MHHESGSRPDLVKLRLGSEVALDIMSYRCGSEYCNKPAQDRNKRLLERLIGLCKCSGQGWYLESVIRIEILILSSSRVSALELEFRVCFLVQCLEFSRRGKNKS